MSPSRTIAPIAQTFLQTALLTLGQAAVILKVFDYRFFSIGILFAVTSILLIIVSFYREMDSDRAFSDVYTNRYDGLASSTRAVDAPPPTDTAPSVVSPASRSFSRSQHLSPPSPSPANVDNPQAVSQDVSPSLVADTDPAKPQQTKPIESQSTDQTGAKDIKSDAKVQEIEREFGGPFQTAGGVVLLFGGIVAGMEIALFVLILNVG